MAEVVVDRKHRITLPKELRKRLRIEAGSTLVAELAEGRIALKPKVPVAKPTNALWGLTKGIVEENPKMVARQAVAERAKRKMVRK